MEAEPNVTREGRTSSFWLDWPAGPIRVGVVFLVGATLLAAAGGYPGVIRKLSDDAARGSALSYADREIAGGNGLVADQNAVYEARGRIPEDETYHVAVGSDYPGGSDLTVQYVESYYQYFLMPRRPSGDARWIICYGCDLSQYGERAEVVWRDDEGIAIARIR